MTEAKSASVVDFSSVSLVSKPVCEEDTPDLMAVHHSKPSGSVMQSFLNFWSIPNVRLAFFGFGVFVCYFYYGVLQENITRRTYSTSDGKTEIFEFAACLVAVQCLINTLFAKSVITASSSLHEDTVPNLMYALVAGSYLLAMVASNSALQHVAYPTQVLCKSAKPIPVMALGVLLARKRYPAAKYIFVLMIVIGCALFLYKDKPAKTTKKETHLLGTGEILLLLSLLMDGVTGGIQDKMRKEHHTDGYHMMYNMNKWSFLYSIAGVLLTGRFFLFVDFVQRHPSLLINIPLFALSSALGQMFIFLLISGFGPLPCSIVTTCRKFFTILFSVLFFGNSLNGRQWIATAVVFLGLALDSRYGKEKKSPPTVHTERLRAGD